MREKPHALDSSSPPLFIVSNHHGPDAGVHPTFTGDDPRVYQSYFENCYGEQVVFVYNRDTREAVPWCGDAGWQPYAVKDGHVEGLLLSAAEQLWLQACWQAVTGSESR